MNARPCFTFVIGGLVVAHAIGHPFDHPHTHTPVAGEGEPTLGKLAVVSSSTSRHYVLNAGTGHYSLTGSALAFSTSQSSNTAHR